MGLLHILSVICLSTKIRVLTISNKILSLPDLLFKLYFMKTKAYIIQVKNRIKKIESWELSFQTLQDIR